MKLQILIFPMILALVLPGTVAADAPHELAGFVLGGDMKNFKDRVEGNTVIPVRYLESLKEVEAIEIRGFKTGLVTYTTCRKPSRIVRLKFKYADSSRRFFEELLKRYRTNLGKPDEWRGDPFHIVVAWKWRFTDKDNNRISLILYHNTRDEEEKKGTVVKMTMWNVILEEDKCFAKKHFQVTDPPKFTFKDPQNVNWDNLIPRR